MFALLGVIVAIWSIKYILEVKRKKVLEDKQKQWNRIKLRKEIRELEIEIIFEEDKKQKELLKNEKRYLEEKFNAL
jgi:hypothetical protein